MPTSGLAPLLVAFDASQSFDPEGDALTYSWNFGDGSTSVEEVSPTHEYLIPNAYTARLTVFDSLNERDYETFTITVVNSPAQLPAVDSGRYTTTGAHAPSNTDYFVGVGGLRNFFVFDLSGLALPARVGITSATLHVNAGDVTQGGFGGITYTLYDVSTPVATLVAGGTGLTDIYDDLGTGTPYSAEIAIAPEDAWTTVSIPLLPATVSALNAATDIESDGLVALGGTPSGNPGNMAFFGTDVTGVTIELSFGPRPTFGPVLYDASLIVHGIGNDATDGSAYPTDARVYFGLPIGARCGGTTPYTAMGVPVTNYCAPAVRQAGKPITGKGTLSPTTFGLGFGLAPSVLTGTATGSLPSRSPFLYSTTYATIFNAGGGFFYSGAGPGTRTLTQNGHVLKIAPGARQFGGTMRLLGKLGAQRGFKNPGQSGIWQGTHTWNLLPVIGRGTSFTDTTTTRLSNPTVLSAQDVTLAGTGFPWTTGNVGVRATGFFSTSLYRAGFDNRTASGSYGSIQFVSPALVQWQGPGAFEELRGVIAILNIKFLPEPQGWVMLGVGVCALALLRRVNRRG
jgi:PKD repeat protein